MSSNAVCTEAREEQDNPVVLGKPIYVDPVNKTLSNEPPQRYPFDSAAPPCVTLSSTISDKVDKGNEDNHPSASE